MLPSLVRVLTATLNNNEQVNLCSRTRPQLKTAFSSERTSSRTLLRSIKTNESVITKRKVCINTECGFKERASCKLTWRRQVLLFWRTGWSIKCYDRKSRIFKSTPIPHTYSIWTKTLQHDWLQLCPATCSPMSILWSVRGGCAVFTWHLQPLQL